MGRLLALLVTLLAVACGGLPDPRHGSIVLTDPALAPIAASALEQWSKATQGDTEFRIAARCESGESCARVSLLDGEPTEWGGSMHQHPGGDEPGWAQIEIARWLLEDAKLASSMLAHELGHFLYLNHTADENDLMNPIAGTTILRPTLAEYDAQWGTALAHD